MLRDAPLEIQGRVYHPTSSVIKQLQITRQTLWRWRKKGLIPSGHSLPNKRVYYTDTEIEKIWAYCRQVEPNAVFNQISLFEGSTTGVNGDSSLSETDIYLDNNATTQTLKSVRQGMMQNLEEGFGNPSSSHSRGGKVREAVFLARRKVADLIGTEPENIIFTSGATESNNMVLRSFADPTTDHIVTTAIEHSSIVKPCDYLEREGVRVSRLNVTAGGRLKVAELEQVFSTEKPTLVALHWVNSETGVIQPIEEIATLCRAYKVPLLCDAAQAVGRIPIELDAVDVDFLTASAHKFHGPPGVGILVSKNSQLLKSFALGGDQEMALRPGTENVPGIVGLGIAAKERKKSLADFSSKIAELRDSFEQAIIARLPFVKVNGDMNNRVCNTSNLQFTGLDGQILLAQFNSAGIYCSQGSACSSAIPEPSSVLTSMGLSRDAAYSSVRFSFGALNSKDDVTEAIERIIEKVLFVKDMTEKLGMTYGN